MGVDVYVLDFLLAHRGSGLGDTLCLGRQSFNVDDNEQSRAILARHDLRFSLADLKSQGTSADMLLRQIGSRTVQSLDISDFEGATIIHDLGDPVPDSLLARFDCIFDGGTLEHVYDFPQAIDNVKRMLKIGGIFLSVNAANNQLGHGFYQFSPELFWRVFGAGTGFTIEQMQLVPLSGTHRPTDLTDPSGQRQEIGATPTAMYLMVACRKLAEIPAPVRAYQSDYAAAWDRHGRT